LGRFFSIFNFKKKGGEKMKKLLLGFTIVTLVFVASSALVYADKPEHHGQRGDDNNNRRIFNPGNELAKSKCTNPTTGNAIIDVSQKVQNDADSGEAGNYWAFDYYARHITVWKTNTANTYCAVVTYDGKFYAVPGQIGPGNTPLNALINTPTDEPINGRFTGGRRETITGTLLTTPLWSTHGNVGTFNYKCDITGTCPGVINWTDQYFSTGYTNPDDWWGWKYDGGSHGTWINAISGNSGNIL
jgi:hypothetical protein